MLALVTTNLSPKKALLDGPIHTEYKEIYIEKERYLWRTYTFICFTFTSQTPNNWHSLFFLVQSTNKAKNKKVVIEKRKTLNKLSMQIKSLAHCHMNTNLDNASFYNLRVFSRSVPKVIVFICPKDIRHITTNPTRDKQHNATSRCLLYGFPFLLYSPSLWICKC